MGVHEHWRSIVGLYPKDQPITGVEVGVWKAHMSQYLLTELPQLHLLMVDRWCPPAEGTAYHESGDSKAYYSQADHLAAMTEAARRTTQFGERAVMVRADSVVAASLLSRRGGPFVDFVFIDADHTYEAVKLDILSWMQHLRPGGIISGHDWSKYDVARAVSDTLGDVERLPGDVWWKRTY